jgi:hypothetical protein
MLRYQHLTEDELLHVADERDQLTDEARVALESELTRRNLSTSEVNAYKRQCADDNEADKLRRAKRQVIPNLGLGKKFLGRQTAVATRATFSNYTNRSSGSLFSGFPFTPSPRTQCVVIWNGGLAWSSRPAKLHSTAIPEIGR